MTIAQDSNQWIFTEDEVMSSPCILDGLDPAEERSRRAKGVNFITQAGILLKLPQLTIATASIFFHRFFMRQTMLPEKGGSHHYHRFIWNQRATNLSLTSEWNIAATALFLATKTEENCRKTREIVVAVAKVAQKNPSLIIDEQSKEYWKWRDSILFLEEQMLELLTFDLVVDTPHTNLLRCLESLSIEENKSLRNTAWAFLNDSCMTPLCLMMPALDITIAAIYFAVKLNNETLPDVDNKPWWHRIDGDPEKIVKAVTIVSRFWTENPLRKSDRPQGSSPSSQDDLERTRRRGSDYMSSAGDFSDNLIESVQTPMIQGSSKSQDTPDSSIRQADTVISTIEKKSHSQSESESSLKIDTSDAKPSPQSSLSQERVLHKISLESDGNGEIDRELENQAYDPNNSSQTQESQHIQSSTSNSNPVSSPAKRKLSEEESDQRDEKRLKTEDSANE
ncbi:hypothetical protein EPUL_003681 [Erysiphe pulchra]|uniref:RNA polymerase II holoenzyme cyclin-like subunit n=1 Tax=Erysiphe pulchra TaxID=225359 RepID=A0A2S4PQU4_9PEZI|nr:hypothetical protein EPUL_003681 [Erysiphe pulchra]